MHYPPELRRLLREAAEARKVAAFERVAARRENHVGLFNRVDDSPICPTRPTDESRAQVYADYGLQAPQPDLADLIAQHNIHVSPFDAIVYARIDKREVGVKYSATGGDKAKAVRLAVREVLRLVGVTA